MHTEFLNWTSLILNFGTDVHQLRGYQDGNVKLPNQKQPTISFCPFVYIGHTKRSSMQTTYFHLSLQSRHLRNTNSSRSFLFLFYKASKQYRKLVNSNHLSKPSETTNAKQLVQEIKNLSHNLPHHKLAFFLYQ